MISRLRILVLVAFRNLFAHWVRTIFVGSIIVFGATLLVVGSAFMASIDKGMSAGVIGSLGGHLQVYSSQGKDEFSLFGGSMMGAPDIGRIDDFSKLRKVAEGVDGVKAILPMGIDMATATSPGELERALGELRTAVRDEDAVAIPALRTRIRDILAQLEDELTKNAQIVADKERIEEGLGVVREARTEAFWSRFDTSPLSALEFLDTRVAPFTEEGRMMYFRYVGTDLEAYPKYFDRFEVVEGEVVPPGHRGFMFNHRFREERVKHFVARNFDKLRQAVVDKGESIAKDPALSSRVRKMSKQYRRITYQLTAAEAETLKAELTKFLGEEGSLDQLLESFLTITDDNLLDRFDFFYATVAPKIDLYDFDVGDTITLRGFTRSGFLKSVNVKIYGVFQFKGLESSDVAGGHNVVDLLTFRELYGLMTAEKKKELAGIREEVGLEDVSAADAEAELFGEDTAIVEAVDATDGFDEFAGVDLQSERDRMASIENAVFDKTQQDRGLALNSAIILEDPEAIAPMQAKLTKAIDEAGLELRVVDWRTAAGIVGQFIGGLWALLLVATIITFLVALIVIITSLVIATMERTTEIGTMRAIGAQRSTVLLMFVLEAMLLGILAGLVGMAIGSGIIFYLGSVGVPAPKPEMTFLFGGPRLYPQLSGVGMVFSFFVVFVVSLLSTIVPAILVTRIQPIMAMRAKE
ncbi:MAG: FtsX-like permease family protein [Deltaproteobacteria bacterium]